MSVINSVLKDLEARTSEFTPIGIASAEEPSVSKKSSAVLYSFLGLALLAAATALGWMYYQDRQTVVLVTPAIAKIVAAPTEVVPVAVVVREVAETPPANQIIGLQIRELEDEISFEFSLRDKVVSYLKERTEDRFVYHLKSIESQIVAPVIRDNRWIRQLSINRSDEGIDINFETAAGILVETDQLRQEDEQIWVIRLRQTTPVPAEVKPEVKVALVAVEAAVPEKSAPPESINEMSTAKPEPEKKEVKVDIKTTNPDGESVSQLQYAVELMRSSRNQDAERLLLRLLQGSEDFSARRHLLALYSRQKRDDDFARLLQESLAKHPQQAIFKTEYARSLFRKAAYGSVIELFADESITDVAQQSLLAASYQRLDQHPDAIRHYRLALARDRQNAKNWIGLGISQEHTAAIEDALNSYRNAMKIGNLNDRLLAFVAKRSRTLEKVLN